LPTGAAAFVVASAGLEVVAIVVGFEEVLIVAVDVEAVPREPPEIGEVIMITLGCSPDRVGEGVTVMTEVSTALPVPIGVSRGGIDMTPVTVERAGSVMTEMIVSETGEMLVGLAVKPIKVSITAMKIESMVLPTGCWCRAWWLQAIHKTRPWIRGRRDRSLDRE
jgi:hypothetical protein